METMYVEYYCPHAGGSVSMLVDFNEINQVAYDLVTGGHTILAVETLA